MSALFTEEAHEVKPVALRNFTWNKIQSSLYSPACIKFLLKLIARPYFQLLGSDTETIVTDCMAV